MERAANAIMPKTTLRKCQQTADPTPAARTLASNAHGVKAEPRGKRPRKMRNKAANTNIETAEKTALATPIPAASRNASCDGKTKQNATEVGSATNKNDSIIVIDQNALAIFFPAFRSSKFIHPKSYRRTVASTSCDHASMPPRRQRTFCNPCPMKYAAASSPCRPL